MSQVPIVIQRSFKANHGDEKRSRHRETGLVSLETVEIPFYLHLAGPVTRSDILSPADLK